MQTDRFSTAAPRAAFGSIILALLAPTAIAQSMSDKAVEAEIEFARGLSRDWAFVDMAQAVLDDVAGADVSERMKEELALVNCEVFTNAAKATSDVAKRGALLEQAITAYQDYLDDNQYAANRSQAEKSLVDLAITYARNVDISLTETAGEEAEELKTKKDMFLEAATARTETLLSELNAIDREERTQGNKLDRLNLMLQLGDIYGRRAQASPDAFAETAIEKYSEILFDEDGGEDSEFGLRANAGIAKVYEDRADPDEGDVEIAREFYGGVIQKVIPMDNAEREEVLGWSELEMGIKQKRFLYVELAVPGTQRTSRALGDLDYGIELALYFYNLYRQEGFQLSSLGYTAMLEVAETFLGAGGFIGGDLGKGQAQWYQTEEELKEAGVNRRQRRTAVEFALDLARQVATDGAGTREGVEAGLLLDRINQRPGIELPPEQMYQAALAQYRSGENNDAALEGFYGLLGQLDTVEPADRVEFGSKTYNGIGNTLYRQGRYLQSAMAFREALTNWRDPEWDSSNAQRYLSAVQKFRTDSGSKDDAKINALVTEAENFKITFADENLAVDMIIFNQAEKELKRDNFEAAIAKYGEIASDAGMYEPAQIRIGQALMQMRKFGAARTKFDEFLDGRAKDPNFAPTTSIAEERRHQAVGRAIYNAAFIDNLAAKKTYKDSQGADASKYAKVIERLDGFANEFRDVSSFAMKAQAMQVTAYARSGDPVKAAEVMAEMVEAYPDKKETADAGIDLYQSYRAQRERLLAVEGDAQDTEAITALTRNMSEALKVANGITLTASYANLRTESRLWQQLDEWENALQPLTRIVQRYSDDEKYGERVVKQVVPDLAEALIETGDVSGAKDLLSPYVVGEDAVLTTRTPTILMARSMIGSLINDGNNIKTVPGAGGTDEEFAYITDRLDSIENSIDKWTCEWYEAKFTAIYAYYVWGQQDDRKLATAKKVIDDLVTVMGGSTQFELVDEGCAQPDTDPMIMRRLGGGVLAARYRWLHSRTR